MCIVDEAGQMTLPVALGPILHSKYGILQPIAAKSQATILTFPLVAVACAGIGTLA